MDMREAVEIAQMMPDGQMYLPDMNSKDCNMLIVGNTRNISHGWFAFFNNETYRKIFEQEFIEMMSSGEEMHI